MPVDRDEQHDDRPDEVGSADQAGATPSPVVVRRHAGLAALVGGAASAVAIAYLWRASQTMAALDWGLFGVMAVVATLYLASLVDARTPLLVADDLGVRIRLGSEWRGLPWEAIGQVVVHPRKSLLRDGRLVFSPRSMARALEGLDVKARRHVAMNQKMYGAPLAVPLGNTTRVLGSAAGERGVADDIAALALGRVDVVVLDPETLEVVDGRGPEPEPAPEQTAAGSSEDGPTSKAASDATAGPATPKAASGTAGESDSDTPRGSTTDKLPSAAPGAAAPGAAAAGTDETRMPQVVFPAAGIELAHTAAAAPAPENASAQDPDPYAPEEGGARSARRGILGGIGMVVSRVAKGRAQDLDTAEAGSKAEPDGSLEQPETGGAVEPASTEAREPSAPSPTAALRDTRPALRAEATLDVTPTAGTAALDPSTAGAATETGLPEGRELRRPGSVDLVFERVDVQDRVRPISTLGDPVEPLVIDDYVTEPAYDPVIGPELTAARTRLGLSVDDLAERTRIRPHVIESIEVDDFAPCGGDFYARGHLRTLARILGKDVEPLLEKFEERYATAPINARRVFEAELATGMTGSMRSTVGGPSWGLLVGVVLCLVLVWGVLRLFTTEPADMPAPVVNGAAVADTADLGANAPGGVAPRTH